MLRNPLPILATACAGTSAYLSCLHQQLLLAGHAVHDKATSFQRLTRVLIEEAALPRWRHDGGWLPSDVFAPFAFDWERSRFEIVVGPLRGVELVDGIDLDGVWLDILHESSVLFASFGSVDLARPDAQSLQIDQQLAIQLRALLRGGAHARRLTVMLQACDRVAQSAEQARQWSLGVLQESLKVTRAVCASGGVELRAFPLTAWGFGKAPPCKTRFPVDAEPSDMLAPLRAGLLAVQGAARAAGPSSDPARSDLQPYDVALSFAGEQRAYVEQVASGLTARGMRVFYDKSECAELWGEDLAQRMAEVYGEGARYVVVFMSEDYLRKYWTTYENVLATSRARRLGLMNVLPVRFDDTQLPTLRKGIGEVDARQTSPAELVNLLVRKLGARGTRATDLAP